MYVYKATLPEQLVSHFLVKALAIMDNGQQLCPSRGVNRKDFGYRPTTEVKLVLMLHLFIILLTKLQAIIFRWLPLKEENHKRKLQPLPFKQEEL